MKIFISYATEDLAMAGTLYRKLSAAGAFVFQFGESETAGKATWEEILASIRQCDVFILLVSSHSVHSRPVKEELSYAHYWHINTDEKNPSRLIPAIIERSVEPPPLIQHFTRFDLTALETAMPRLLKQLGLEKRAVGTTALDYASLPDPGEVFEKYLKKNPQPSVASLWSEKAEKIVTNYQLLKPKEITPALESSHLKTILRAQTGSGSTSADRKPFAKYAKYDGLFLGVLADTPEGQEQPDSTDRLSELLLTYDPKKALLSVPLSVPKVAATENGLEWKPVIGASAYAVERSTDKDYKLPVEVYRGTNTSYDIGPLLTQAFYRVKAVGGVFRPDSAWSEPIRKTRLLAPSAYISTTLAAPTLRLKPSVFGIVLAWTKIDHAFGYVLERSDGVYLADWKVVYTGVANTYTDLKTTSGERNLLHPYEPASFDTSFAGLTGLAHDHPRGRSYRVKATAVLGPDSDWSNIVVADLTDPLNPFGLDKK